MATKRYYGTGKRKTSVARVWLKPGEGNAVVNKRPVDDYFGRETAKMVIQQAFELTGTQNQFDLVANVSGGGTSGQADAIKHGIAKALLQYDSNLRDTLKKEGIGPATVYRTVKTLQQLGCLHRVHEQSGEHRFVARHSPHSHTLVCRSCGQVIEFEACDLSVLEKLLTF